MADTNRIERVAMVGAGGNAGKFIAEALLKTGKHKVTAISRQDSTNKIADGIHIARVDYSKKESLVEALRGQDALVITMGVFAPKDSQQKLVDAAGEAGVPWILPSEWCPDSSNEEMSNDMMVGPGLKAVRNHITQLGQSHWIAVCTGFWYEFSLSLPAAFGVDFQNKTATLFDDGKARMNTSTWPQVGAATAALLSLPVKKEGPGPYIEQFRDSWVYPKSFLVSQQEMLESAYRVTGTSTSDWTINYVSSKERYEQYKQKLLSGDQSAFVQTLYTRGFFPDEPAAVELKPGKTLFNDLVALPQEKLDDATERAWEMAKSQVNATYR